MASKLDKISYEKLVEMEQRIQRLKAEKENTELVALRQKVTILVELQEIVAVLEQDGDLRDLLRRKAHAAITERNPLARFPV